MVQRYLKELQDHNEVNENGDTLLHAIVRRKDKYRQECLLALLVYGRCDIDGGNTQGFTPLHIAVEVCSYVCVCCLCGCIQLVCIEKVLYCIVVFCLVQFIMEYNTHTWSWLYSTHMTKISGYTQLEHAVVAYVVHVVVKDTTLNT